MTTHNRIITTKEFGEFKVNAITNIAYSIGSNNIGSYTGDITSAIKSFKNAKIEEIVFTHNDILRINKIDYEYVSVCVRVNQFNKSKLTAYVNGGNRTDKIFVGLTDSAKTKLLESVSDDMIQYFITNIDEMLKESKRRHFECITKTINRVSEDIKDAKKLLDNFDL